MKGLGRKASSSEGFVVRRWEGDMGSNAVLDLSGNSLKEIAVERRGPFPDGPEP